MRVRVTHLIATVLIILWIYYPHGIITEAEDILDFVILCLLGHVIYSYLPMILEVMWRIIEYIAYSDTKEMDSAA